RAPNGAEREDGPMGRSVARRRITRGAGIGPKKVANEAQIGPSQRSAVRVPDESSRLSRCEETLRQARALLAPAQSPRIHSWAACSARPRVGQGRASQLGMSPVGEVISWIHC